MPSRAPSTPGSIWDPASGRFDVALLRLALVKRCLTPDDLARRGSVGRSSVYKALRGEGVRQRTAMHILVGLSRIEPVMPLIPE